MVEEQLHSDDQQLAAGGKPKRQGGELTGLFVCEAPALTAALGQQRMANESVTGLGLLLSTGGRRRLPYVTPSG